jgi:hypothetical protein
MADRSDTRQVSSAELVGTTVEGIEAALGGLPQASKHASVLAADALQRLLEKIR